MMFSDLRNERLVSTPGYGLFLQCVALTLTKSKRCCCMNMADHAVCRADFWHKSGRDKRTKKMVPWKVKVSTTVDLKIGKMSIRSKLSFDSENSNSVSCETKHDQTYSRTESVTTQLIFAPFIIKNIYKDAAMFFLNIKKCIHFTTVISLWRSSSHSDQSDILQECFGKVSSVS